MSFHRYVCRSFLLKSSDFWGDMGTSETLLKIKSLEGANCNGRASHHCSGNSSIFLFSTIWTNGQQAEDPRGIQNGLLLKAEMDKSKEKKCIYQILEFFII